MLNCELSLCIQFLYKSDLTQAGLNINGLIYFVIKVSKVELILTHSQQQSEWLHTLWIMLKNGEKIPFCVLLLPVVVAFYIHLNTSASIFYVVTLPHCVGVTEAHLHTLRGGDRQ